MISQRISDAALAVLRDIAYDSHPYRARITSGQLTRPLYEEVNEVLVRLGGKWKGGRTGAHIFPYYDPRPLLSSVLATETMPPKNPYAFFPTPPELVETIMQSPLFDDLQDDDAVLEPSAGYGALAEGLRKRLAHVQVQIDCCEIQPINQQVLHDKGFEVVHDDFLTYQPTKRYRAVVMNPPFSVEEDRLAYIPHILRAWELLEENGFLIAIAPSGYTYRTDRKSYDFLSFVLTYGRWSELPKKSFHASGTESNVTLITLQKLDLSWRYRPYRAYPSWFCFETALYAENGGEEIRRVHDWIITRLNSRELCSDPKQPAWAQTQKTIRDYYQLVIADARRQGQHLAIRAQDWPHLERDFMSQWDDCWEPDRPQENKQEEVCAVSPQVEADTLQEDTSLKVPLETPPPGAEAVTHTPASIPLSMEEKEEELSASASGTPLYSPLPYKATCTYEEICESYQRLRSPERPSRESYPALPWSMETVIGTTWRHIQSGEAQTIHHLDMNRAGRPILCIAKDADFSKQSLELHIGFWSGGRYVIEDWLRIDHLSEEEQLRWFGVELAWLRGRIALCQQKVTEYQWDRVNREIYAHLQKEYQLQLHLAQTRMRDFAAQNTIPSR